jgi:hypothetical protein
VSLLSRTAPTFAEIVVFQNITASPPKYHRPAMTEFRRSQVFFAFFPTPGRTPGRHFFAFFWNFRRLS